MPGLPRATPTVEPMVPFSLAFDNTPSGARLVWLKFPEALEAEQADLNLSLIQQASMLGRVMHGKSRPKPSARFLAESVRQRFA